MRTSQTQRQALRAILDPQKRLASLLVALSAAASILGLPPQFAAAQNAGPQPRIALPIDENSRVTLRGNAHPLARAQNDVGVAADSQPLRRMLLLLQRGPEQEAALRKLLDDQQNASSPSFHRWLTPQQFGQQFGAADADLEAVTRWLELHGFEVNRVSAGKTLIEFSGNAGQVREAFQTEIHRYLAGGEEHLANAGDPQIPTALASVVVGPVSLNNFPVLNPSHIVGAFQKNRDTGQVTPLPFTFSADCTTPCNALGPGDFAAIYNIRKLWSPSSGAPIDGATVRCVITTPFGSTSAENVWRLAFR